MENQNIESDAAEVICDAAEDIMEMYVNRNADFTTVFESLAIVAAGMLADYAQIDTHEFGNEMLAEARNRFIASLDAKIEFAKKSFQQEPLIIT